MKKILRRLQFVLLILLHSSFILCLCGCAAVGVAAYKLSGPPDVPAKYTLPATPTLVFVENYRHQSSVSAHADTLAQLLFSNLEANKVGPLISLDKVQELRDSQPGKFPTMTIAQLAQALGAEQVVYVELRSADVTPLAGGAGYVGEAAAVVKVVDAKGTTLWPVDQSEGYGVAAKTSMGSKTYASPADVREVLYAQLTEQMSHLFHKWKPEFEGSEKWENQTR